MMKITFSKLMFNILKNYMKFKIIFQFTMKTDNDKNVVTNLADKTEYVIDIRNLKQALNH